MLHTLSVSPWHADIAAMLRLMEHGDDLVLLSDGVTAAIADGRFLEILQSAPITLYVLQDDVDARGLAGQIADSVGRVSYTDFVRLTVKHAGQLACGDGGIVVYFLTPFRHRPKILRPHNI